MRATREGTDAIRSQAACGKERRLHRHALELLALARVTADEDPCSVRPCLRARLARRDVDQPSGNRRREQVPAPEIGGWHGGERTETTIRLRDLSIDFSGQVAIVTGAGRGLGRLYALELAQRGASVIVNDVGGTMHGDGADHSIADEVVHEIVKAGGVAVASHDSV